MKTLSEQASALDSTCELTLKKRRLPNIEALSRHIRETRTGARLQGVEAKVIGKLTRQREGLILVLSETGERLPLAPLRNKVQWDVKANEEHPMTPEEKSAYARLRTEKTALNTVLEITGPLEKTKTPAGKPHIRLQVRLFRALPSDRKTALPDSQKRAGAQKDTL